MSKTYAIGDIHGAYKALIQVLERSPIKEGDTLICLGDYVDGWSESAQVVEHLIDLQDKYNCIFIRGNHDDWCKNWLINGYRNKVWTQQGGQATIESYINTGLLTSEAHRKFFRSLYNYYIDDKNRGFVHGGFVSKKGLGHDSYQSNYYWDRDLWNLALLQHNKEEHGNSKSIRFRKHSEIFIGHTSTVNWEVKPHYREYGDINQPKNGGIIIPMNRCNVWNLDTGAGFYGKLTIMDVDSKEYWQSDLVKDLYPNEHGR